MSWSLMAFLAANFAAAMSGGIFSPDQWFRDLKKPRWQPKDWMFPVVWTILYGVNGIAGWLIWQEVGFEGAGVLAISVYGISLLFNALWSFVFFGMKRIDLATYEAALLWLSLAVQVVLFYAISTTAGLILIPYLAWVSVAFFLSLTIWRLNPQAVKG